MYVNIDISSVLMDLMDLVEDSETETDYINNDNFDNDNCDNIDDNNDDIDETDDEEIKKIKELFWTSKKKECKDEQKYYFYKLLTFVLLNIGFLYLIIQLKSFGSSFSKQIEDYNIGATLIQLSVPFAIMYNYISNTFQDLYYIWKNIGYSYVVLCCASLRYEDNKFIKSLLLHKNLKDTINIFYLRDRLELKIKILKNVYKSKNFEETNHGIINAFSTLKNTIKKLGSNLTNSMQRYMPTYSRGAVNIVQDNMLTSYGSKLIKYYLNIPIAIKKLDESDLKKSLDLMSIHFNSTYDKRIEKFFKEQITRIYYNSQLKSSSEYRDKCNLFLIGPAGTGKTDTSRTFINLLGLEFCEINASSIKPKDFFVKDKNRTCGIIAEFLLNQKKKYNNFCLFIDEIDNLTNSNDDGEKFEIVLKNILENKTIYDESLQMTIDISNMIVIVASNGVLLRDQNNKNEHNLALNQRFSTIEFNSPSLEQKITIGIDKFLPLISKERSYKYNQDDIEFIKDKIVQYDFLHNKGCRILRNVINNFIIYRLNPDNDIINYAYEDIFNEFHNKNENANKIVEEKNEYEKNIECLIKSLKFLIKL